MTISYSDVVAPAFSAVAFTVAACGLPYSEASLMMKTFLAFRLVAMKLPMPAPCTLSLAMRRCQYFQPCEASAALVADAEMVGILPSSRTGSAWADSPEKVGPIIATILSLVIACFTRGTACAPLPWLSYVLKVILTFGFVALYWS